MLPIGVAVIPKKPMAPHFNFTNMEFDSKCMGEPKNILILSKIQKEFTENFAKSQKKLKNEIDALYKVKDVSLKVIKKEKQSGPAQRTCDISTATIQWEGVESYLHIIEDNTDLIKHEGSKVSQKCHEILSTY